VATDRNGSFFSSSSPTISINGFLHFSISNSYLLFRFCCQREFRYFLTNLKLFFAYISYFSLKDNIIACSGISQSGKFPAF
jgi:hypothetical protein